MLNLKKPDEPEIPISIAQLVFRTNPMSELGLPLFEVQAVPGKGKGLVARFEIAKGTRILYENPLFTTPHLAPISQMESNIATKLRSLSKTRNDNSFCFITVFLANIHLAVFSKQTPCPVQISSQAK